MLVKDSGFVFLTVWITYVNRRIKVLKHLYQKVNKKYQM